MASDPQPEPHIAWWQRRLTAVPVIIAANLLVFVLWYVAPSGRLMVDNFVVSPRAVLQGRWWTLLTSVFSHIESWHLLLNMIVLFSFGSVLERLWRPLRFVTFYLAAGAFASLSHCVVSAWLIGADQQALGASGAVAGLLLAFALSFPRQKILVFGIIPIPALLGAIAFVALDLWGLVAQTQGGGLPIGHGAHLGGAAFGGLFYLLYLRRRVKRSPRAGRLADPE